MDKADPYIKTSFVIAPETNTCLRLYALSQDMSLSQVIRTITKNWLRENCMTEEVLKHTIFDQITDEWTRLRFIDPEASLEEFVKHLKSKVGKRLGVLEAVALIDEWKSNMKP